MWSGKTVFYLGHNTQKQQVQVVTITDASQIIFKTAEFLQRTYYKTHQAQCTLE